MGISGNLVYQKLKQGPTTEHKVIATPVHTSVTVRKSDVLEDEYFVKFYICFVGIKSNCPGQHLKHLTRSCEFF